MFFGFGFDGFCEKKNMKAKDFTFSLLLRC